jgi:hypothetical protein
LSSDGACCLITQRFIMVGTTLYQDRFSIADGNAVKLWRFPAAEESPFPRQRVYKKYGTSCARSSPLGPCTECCVSRKNLKRCVTSGCPSVVRDDDNNSGDDGDPPSSFSSTTTAAAAALLFVVGCGCCAEVLSSLLLSPPISRMAATLPHR